MLLHDEAGAAARVLESLGVTLPAVRAQVQRGRPPETPPAGRTPFSPEGRKVLDLALREALALRDNYIGTEHVLLGLVGESEGAAAQILRDLGAEAETVRASVLGALAGEADPLLGPWEAPVAEAGDERTEYHAVRLEGSADTWSETLNALAAEGWRLLSITSEAGETRAFFQRSD